ncbi:dixin-like [Ruditapes philippinarum]|uniref:dixin-like n=1 Tax=Ruditapes philippinarum TaxID=129788 RepID=UPI00295BB55D|nr:dixin-like [Ruditapes philippinarum]
MATTTNMSNQFIMNNLNNGRSRQDHNTSMVAGKPPSRLSPRVMVGFELNILKSQSGSSSAGSSRHVSPVLSMSGLASLRSPTYGSDTSLSPPRLSSGSRSGKISSRIENQLDAYMKWINSQLKKKPGARLVEDLRYDTRDGVAFIHLISVIELNDICFTDKDSGTELEDTVFTPGRGDMVKKAQYDDLMSEYLKLAEDMTVIKKDLSQLQDLLLSGQPPDGEESSTPVDIVEGTTLEQQIVILRSQLQQTKEVNSSLREELSKNKLDLMQIQGVKAGLQQRITDQETTISQLKAELLRRDFQKQNFDSEQTNVSKQLRDKDKIISDLKKDLARREQKIDHIRHDFQMQLSEKENSNQTLKQQMKELNDRFKVVDETGASLKARVATQDKQMARLAGRILHTKNEQVRPPPTGADEYGVLRESLSSLRQCFHNTDPQQHTLDTIEQWISTITERLSNLSNTSSKTDAHSLNSSYEQHVSRKLNFDGTGDIRRNFDGTGDVRRSPITAIPGSKQSSFNPSKLDSPPNQNYTKVLYFTESATTPSMLTIYKRLGEITLHDFKGSFDRPGQYRYHFKALDPEFGTVKEEISNEESVIPGWEGKIVAWIEKDTGQ